LDVEAFGWLAIEQASPLRVSADGRRESDRLSLRHVENENVARERLMRLARKGHYRDVASFKIHMPKFIQFYNGYTYIPMVLTITHEPAEKHFLRFESWQQNRDSSFLEKSVVVHHSSTQIFCSRLDNGRLE
jgi:hypothetical protein